MGSLKLPDAGFVYFDSNAFIYSIVLERSARLRAATHIKSPDAIHAATGLIAGCATFITNDRAYQRIPDLPVQILSEVAALPSD